VILPYEIIYRSAVPAVRSLIAKKMIEEYRLTQKEVATKLGLTQAAVSNYMRSTRAVAVKLDKSEYIRRAVDDLTALLMSGEPNSPEVVTKFTVVCDYIREKRLLCGLHKRLEPTYDTEGCHACDEPLAEKPMV